MLGWKVAAYVVTIAIAAFFAAIELKIRKRIKDQVEWEQKNPADFGDLNDIRSEASVDRRLASLSGPERLQYRRAVVLKFVFVAILLAEVFAFQR